MTFKPHRMILIKRDDLVREITVRNGTARLSSGTLAAGVGLGIAKHKPNEASFKPCSILTILSPAEAIELGMALTVAAVSIYEKEEKI